MQNLCYYTRRGTSTSALHRERLQITILWCSQACDRNRAADNASADLGWRVGVRSVVHCGRETFRDQNALRVFFSGLDSLPLTQGYVKRHFGFPFRDMEVTLLIIMVGQPPVISATASRSPLFSPSFSIFSSVISHNPYAFRNKHR